MGKCNLPGCDEWINAATDVYCCELHRIYHKLDKVKSDYAELEAKLAALVEAASRAPHDMGCSSLQGGQITKDWGKLSRCDCWKKAAIAAAEGR